MRRIDARWGVLLALVLLASPNARAAEITDTATSFEPDKRVDFRLRVGYDFTSKSGSVKREHEGNMGQQSIQVFKDLVYNSERHSMPLRAEIGLYQVLMFSVEMPLILAQSSTLSYDQRLGAGCIYDGPGANCVNQNNSSTTRSDAAAGTAPGAPSTFIAPSGGYDALNNGNTFDPGSALVFRGPRRGGSGGDLLDTINLALQWSVLSQLRDDTKPTWTLAVEYKLSIGNVMAFDRGHPDANHGVADGLDHFIARTAVSRRFKYVEPYASFWFDYPVVRRDDTLFFDYGTAAKNQLPQLAGGTVMGIELVPWERKDPTYKLVFDLSARIQGKFDGRGYSEIWEMLASSPALGCQPPPSMDAQWNPACDSSRTMNKYQGRAYTGLTTIENYAQFGAEVAIALQLSKYARLRTNFLYQVDQSHFVTMDDVGTPTMGGRVTKPSEFNPAFRPIINDVGRRYLVDGMSVFQFGLWAQMMF